ncbi:nuclear transport factor 2 family protein [Kitasatospora sp. NPDC050543]|uniref:nuclear transport factor 2 family protein n=1 Tax=Kitasatospora sp. NPDC050543 TaxID=3364054 RepID=UPI0037969D5E
MPSPAMPKSVLQFFTASQQGDADAWADAFAEDALFHDPVGQKPIEGREAIRAFIKSVLPNFDPFLGLTPLEAHTVGQFVAVSWHGSAVSTTGRPVNWSGINVYELDSEGLIHEAKAFFNHAIFAAQLADA